MIVADGWCLFSHLACSVGEPSVQRLLPGEKYEHDRKIDIS
jgi:hypothetical protein